MMDLQNLNGEKSWYTCDNADEFDSPALLFYPDRIKKNIRKLVEKVRPENLRPHVKTNKTGEVCRLMMDAGIRKFKAATIAEAEMLAMVKAPDVLLAYPATVTKLKRLIRLIVQYPDTHFSFLVDQAEILPSVAEIFQGAQRRASVYIDLNVGMNRTGIRPKRALDLFRRIESIPSIEPLGLHAYDGHIKDGDPEIRSSQCHKAFEPVLLLKKELEKHMDHELVLIAGGTPTCFIHAAAGGRECSPGTFVFWDKGYSEHLPEQPFDWAAVLLCRVISIPANDLVCVDLGYKSVACENPLPRVYFLNAPAAVPVAHSEEHLVLKVPDSDNYHCGDILYGIPWHICPTVALYEKACVMENNRVTGFWKISARDRNITL